MISAAARADLAPTGKIRAGINYGNAVLAQRNEATGEIKGVAVDLARELGRKSELPVELVAFPSAGQMVAALKSGAWDVAFLAAEPGRAGDVGFTAPHLIIEGTYLVPPGSPIKTVAEVDRDGIRIGVAAGSAYDLFLTRNIKHAQFVRAADTDSTFQLILDKKVEVVAGVRQALVANSSKLAGSRVLDERFMAIEQAAGMPKGRDEGLRYLREFIEEMKASGFVERSLKNSGVLDVAVAPPAK
ncbi:MAG: transporter substrate-binding domain-containing protein [Deltaproteobacteria bacterium]|nr:transporter substrate-binding domain-containing protein [Deltaproteobacteria bacterium]